MKILIALLVLLALGAGVSWYAAGRAPGPVVALAAPQKAIGQSSELTVLVDTPAGKLKSLDVALEQGSTHVPVFSLAGTGAAQLVQDGAHRVRLSRAIGKREIPQLIAGQARITVTASRSVLFGLREVATTVSRDLEVRLTPPTVAALSSFQYVNQGGSEMIVYRVSPADVTSGVRVGDHEYPGFPAAGAHIAAADPGLRVAFFALLWNQDSSTPISLYARDDVGNEAHATFDYRVFPKSFRESRIPIDDHFLAKVVPPILANSPELKVADPSDLLAAFLRINGELRRENGATIAALAHETEPQILWQGPFRQLVNTAVEAGFADQRAYVYKGQVVDHQVHLGFDLASVSGAPVLAANRGKVVHAGWLGIYGNCVILDHGMGVQSLYAHLSAIEVKVGDMVSENQPLGRTGSTGLAGGDHLHFTMLLGGNAVTPIDWWSAKWVADRIDRKLHDAGATPDSAAPVQAAGSVTPPRAATPARHRHRAHAAASRQASR
ncbi:MAG TPA: M23 family metallopeptidase [Steroidobacteraceae bacterium]|nr:M23 family metallopeptidase [Steroidobacteraceae bacterium]